MFITSIDGRHMEKRELKIGDVVQIAPSEKTFFSGCFMMVTEPKEWGAQGFIAIPGQLGEMPNRAFSRVTWDQMDYIGRALWVPVKENDE